MQLAVLAVCGFVWPSVRMTMRRDMVKENQGCVASPERRAQKKSRGSGAETSAAECGPRGVGEVCDCSHRRVRCKHLFQKFPNWFPSVCMGGFRSVMMNGRDGMPPP